MSLLWNGKNKMKQHNIQLEPSPTNQNLYQNSAQSSDTSLEGSKYCHSVLNCFIEGISLFASLFIHLIHKCGKKWYIRKEPGKLATVFSWKVTAGMTVEASILLPLLLFFFLNLGCAIEMVRLHNNLQLALWETGNKLSVYGYALDSGETPAGEDQEDSWWKELVGIVFASSYVKNQLIDILGKEYLGQSPLTKGADGLQLWESEIFSGDEIDIVVTYSVSPWSSLAGFLSFRMANRYYAHIWNGYQIPEVADEETKTVYLTENGEVYHLDKNCSYLRISVRQIMAEELVGVKNQHGSHYQPCAKCTNKDCPSQVYVTKEGNCYHYSKECPSLKRTIYSVSLEEAANYRPCSRCGQGNLTNVSVS